MSDIREFLKKKQNQENTGPDTQKEFGRKIRLHRLTVFYRSALIVAVCAAVIALAYIQWKNQVYSTYNVVSSVQREGVSSSSVQKNFNGKVLTYSNDGMSCMDSRGNVAWNLTFEMQNPMISINKGMAAVGDYNGRSIYICDVNGSRGVIDTNLPIRKFCVAGNGVVAAVLDDSEVTWIYLYSASGAKLAYFKTTMKKSGYPMDVCISEDGKLVGVSYLYVDSGVVRSSIAFYNFGEVGKNSSDNMVSSYNYADAVVPMVRFLNREEAFAMADNRLMLYAGGEKPVNVADKLLSSEIQSIFYGEGYVGLVTLNTDGETRYKINVYQPDGSLALEKAFDMEYKEILFSNDTMIIYNETNCCIYNMKGNERFSGTFDKTALLLIPTSSVKKFILVTEETVDTIELR